MDQKSGVDQPHRSMLQVTENQPGVYVAVSKLMTSDKGFAAGRPEQRPGKSLSEPGRAPFEPAKVGRLMRLPGGRRLATTFEPSFDLSPPLRLRSVAPADFGENVPPLQCQDDPGAPSVAQ